MNTSKNRQCHRENSCSYSPESWMIWPCSSSLMPGISKQFDQLH